MRDGDDGFPAVVYDPIPRVAAPSPERFREDYVRPARPVIITGLTDAWPARRLWSLDYFAGALGEARVVSVATSKRRVAVSQDAGISFDRVRLADYVAEMRAGGSSLGYVASPLWHFPPEFFKDFTPPPYCAQSPWYRPKFWLGSRGTVTPLHWDLPHNLSAQMLGRKLWLLYPRNQWPLVYPCSPWSKSPNFSRVDPEAADLGRFPRFARARPLGAILAPGETLYIPPLWWHHVRSLDDCATFNFWFGGSLIAATGAAANAFKRASGLYPGEWG